jgi:glycolate oxidase FAD binding subunit
MTDMANDIASRVQTAYQANTPLNITGAGSKSFLGQVSPDATSLDVKGHSGIIEYDPAELVLVARAGTPLQEIEKLLNDNQQILGFEPPFVDSGATLGGAIASGLAGPARAYSGGVRDFILGAGFINGKGETITAGGKVMKNVAGFDLFRPMAGSMGTLGVLLKTAIRTIPRPEAELSLIQEETNEASALEKINHWTGKTQAISGATWDGQMIRIRLSGSAAGIQHGREQIGGEILTDETYWQNLNNLRLDFFTLKGRLWRISIAAMSGPVGENSPQLIDWGGAQRWLKSDEPPGTIRSRAARLGGHATCFSDDQSVPTFQPLKGNLLTLNRRFKAALDPAGILNPGRLHPEF